MNMNTCDKPKSCLSKLIYIIMCVLSGVLLITETEILIRLDHQLGCCTNMRYLICSNAHYGNSGSCDILPGSPWAGSDQHSETGYLNSFPVDVQGLHEYVVFQSDNIFSLKQRLLYTCVVSFGFDCIYYFLLC